MRSRILVLFCVAALLVTVGLSLPGHPVSAGSPKQDATAAASTCDAAFIKQISDDFTAINTAGNAITGTPTTAQIISIAQIATPIRMKYEDMTTVPAGCEAVQKIATAYLANTADSLLVFVALTTDTANQATYATMLKPMQERQNTLKAALVAAGVNVMGGVATPAATAAS